MTERESTSYPWTSILSYILVVSSLNLPKHPALMCSTGVAYIIIITKTPHCIKKGLHETYGDAAPFRWFKITCLVGIDSS